MNTSRKPLVFLLLLCACGPVAEVPETDELAVATQEAELKAARTEGWKIDGRVQPQIGFFFGRNGTAAKTRKAAYSALAPLTLPAAALTGNAVPLFDVQPDDLAQIDFFVPRPALARALGLEAMFDGSVSRIGLPAEVDAALRASRRNAAPVVKEVRLRAPDAAALPTELSALPENAFVAFDAVAYFTVFITQKAGEQGAAMDGFRAQIAGGGYELGAVAPLPEIPHPQDGGVALVALMTVRAREPLHGKSFVLEVIETR